MGNYRERAKRYNFMEKKYWLHYPQWIEAGKEELLEPKNIIL